MPFIPIPVVPGRDEVANPESRATTSGSGFDADASPRNDDLRQLQFKQLYETIV
jgi:hypothetical protein